MSDQHYKLNQNQDLRDTILEPFFSQSEFNTGHYAGGIRRFEGLTLEAFEKLFENNFVDPDDQQNEAPANQFFLEFLRKFPAVKLHGYAVHNLRNDYRVSIEGMQVDEKDLTPKLQEVWKEMCDIYMPDDWSDTYMWWD